MKEVLNSWYYRLDDAGLTMFLIVDNSDRIFIEGITIDKYSIEDGGFEKPYFFENFIPVPNLGIQGNKYVIYDELYNYITELTTDNEI